MWCVLLSLAIADSSYIRSSTSIRLFLHCFWTDFNWCPHALDKEGCSQLASDSAGEEEGRVEGSEYDDGSVDGSEGSED